MIAGPLAILIGSIAFIVLLIVLLRMHAFFAMILAALAVALVTAPGGPHRFAHAIALTTDGFGGTIGKIGLTLALAAVIGVCLMESGAADKIVRRLIRFCGEGGVAVALLVASFLLSAPVFIDMVFMLILPLARALSLRTGKDYMLYVLAVGAGGIITNGTVPPAPGPLFVADLLKLNLAVTIVAGAVIGIIPAIYALFAARWMNRKYPLDPRSIEGVSTQEMEALAARDESQLPGLAAALAPVALPFVLIGAASIQSIAKLPLPAGLASLIEIAGDKNIALVVGAVVAVAVQVRQKRIPWRKAGTVLAAPLETAAVIILMIGAGSAYGDAIKRAGIDSAVRALAHGGIDYVILGWVLAVMVRGAVGSATVAMITASGIVVSIAGKDGFPIHPLYVLLAIGYGSKALSWMNDTGFWLICRVGGLPTGTALRTWSVMGTTVSIVGFIEILVVSHLWPHLGR